jgi:hypothetical protein
MLITFESTGELFVIGVVGIVIMGNWREFELSGSKIDGVEISFVTKSVWLAFSFVLLKSFRNKFEAKKSSLVVEVFLVSI